MSPTANQDDDSIEYSEEEFEALPPLEKWDILVQEKREVESELGTLGPSRFREEHAAILRRDLPEKTSRATWMKRRQALTSQRTELLERKVDIEARLQELRPVVDAIKAKQRAAASQDAAVVTELRRLIEIVDDLRVELRSWRVANRHTMNVQHDTHATESGQTCQGMCGHTGSDFAGETPAVSPAD